MSKSSRWGGGGGGGGGGVDRLHGLRGGRGRERGYWGRRKRMAGEMAIFFHAALMTSGINIFLESSSHCNESAVG